MCHGQLQVTVITSRAKIPVAQATVLITQYFQDKQDSQAYRLLALAVTNESGNTPILTLPTPPEEDSISPTSTAGENFEKTSGGTSGYSLVDLWVEHPDFVRQKLEGIQIFPQVTTQQSVLLHPLAQGTSSLVAQEELELPVQDL